MWLKKISVQQKVIICLEIKIVIYRSLVQQQITTTTTTTTTKWITLHGSFNKQLVNNS